MKKNAPARIPAIDLEAPLDARLIGLCIRQRRKDTDMTLEELAYMSGISVKSLIKIEKGGYFILSTLFKIMENVGISLAFHRISVNKITTAPEDCQDEWY